MSAELNGQDAAMMRAAPFKADPVLANGRRAHDPVPQSPVGAKREPVSPSMKRNGFARFALAGCTVAATMLSASLSLSTVPAWSQGADYREAAKAPPHWIQFAKLVKYRFEDWIGADEAIANRFRAYIREHAGKEDGPPQMLEVRAWLNPDGTVERVSFPSLNDPQADEDLRTILKRGNVGEAPPPEMLQPLHLRFSLNLK
jgi:hypothetical protein